MQQNKRRERLPARLQYKATDHQPLSHQSTEIKPIGNWLDKIFCGDCTDLMRQMPERSVDLVIADPPYWKVAKEKWDFRWRTESDYVSWSQGWIQEVGRVIKLTGAFYIFGYYRMLAYLLPHIERSGFMFRQQLIAHKGLRALGGRATRGYKMFPNVTECILFFEYDNRPDVRAFLKGRQNALGLTANEINEKLEVKSNGGGVWSLYTGDNILATLPTEEMWRRLQGVLNFDKPYSEIAHTFNVEMGITDVWNDIDFYEEKRFHPTQKPFELIARLIRASSNPGMIVLDPFVGVGSTALAAKKEGRYYIGFDNNPKYIEIAKRRLAGPVVGQAALL